MRGYIKRNDIPKEIRKTIGDSNDKIINALVLDLIENSYDKNYLAFSKDIFKALNELRRFNYEKIYHNPKIKTQKDKIENMFKQLFYRYYQDLKNENIDAPIYHYFLNDMGDIYCGNTDKKRMVIDFIAGMTDDFFNNQYIKSFVPQSYGYSL